MSRGLLQDSKPRTADTETLTQSDYETLAAFRHSLRRFFHFSQAAAQAEGLTTQQHQALLAIKGFPDHDAVTVGQLAEQLFIKHHSAVGLVDRLVEQGLVERRNSAEDRRQVYLSLSSRGERILSHLSVAHREELRRLSPKLQRLLGQIAA